MRCLLIIFLLFNFGTAFAKNPSEAKRTLKIVTDEWEGYADKKGGGAYLELLKTAIGNEYDLKFVFLPWKRALKMFVSGEVDGLIGDSVRGLKSKIGTDKFIYPKHYIDLGYVTAYYKTGRYKAWDASLLKTEKVVWLNGYDFHKTIGHKINYYEVKSIKSGLKMVEKGRSDILLDYKEEVGPVIKRDFKPTDFVSAETKIAEIFHLFLQKNEKNREVLAIWDKKVAELIKTKKIFKIFEKNGVKYPTGL